MAERVATIQALWRDFLPRTAEIRSRRGSERYAVIENDVLDTEDPPILRALVAVSTFDGAPSWCERHTIEPGRFAIFEHKGPARALKQTVAAIQTNWSGRIPGLFQRDLEIFVYPDGYDPMALDATLAYWLPLPP